MIDATDLTKAGAFPGLVMCICDDPTKPSQQAVNGAFDSYVEGGKKDKKRPTPFGFSVLRHATEEQLLAAMPFVRASHGMSNAQVQATLTPRVSGDASSREREEQGVRSKV